MPDDYPSNARIDRVGEKLKRGEPLSDADETLLETVFRAHTTTLLDVVDRLRALTKGFPEMLEPTSRVKTRVTLTEKLMRGPTKLSRVQDIAGARLILFGGAAVQDRIVGELTAEFSQARIVDRRAAPSSGYRAVHVVARIERCLVEIQVRTVLQHMWAETFERLADQVGRQIRYGGEASTPEGQALVDGWISNASRVAEMDEANLLGIVRNDLLRLGDSRPQILARIVKRWADDLAGHLDDQLTRPQED